MIIKKSGFLAMFAITLLIAFTFTACNSNDPNDPAPVPRPVDSLRVELISESVIKVVWNHSPDKDSAWFKEYKVEVVPMAADSIPRVFEVPKINNSVEVPNIGSGTTYTITVTAVSESGKVSTPKSIGWTNPDEPAPVPRPVDLLKIEVVSASEVKLEWEHSPDKDSAWFKEYKVEVQQTGIAQPSQTLTVAKTNNSVGVLELISGTTYTFTVMAVSDLDKVSIPKSIEWTNPDEPPPPPPLPVPRPVDLLQAETISNSKIKVEWQHSPDRDSAWFKGYRVEVYQVGTALQPRIFEIPRTNNSVEVPDLYVGTTYNFIVMAVSDSGKFSTSQSIEWTIPAIVKWITYTRANSGLLNDAINCISVDNSGSVWIGTHAGLNKFDASNWTNYTASNSGLSTNWIDAIAFDNNNNAWIGSSGLNRFNGSSWTTYTTSNSGLPGNRINTIAVNNNNEVWSGTINGLSRFNGSTWTTYTVTSTNSGLLSNRINAVAAANNNVLWIGSNNGLNRAALTQGVNLDIMSYKASSGGLLSNNINCIAIDKNNDVWIGSDGGLNKLVFTGVVWTRYTTANGLLANNIQCIAIDKHNNVWVGTSSGLNKFNGSTWTTYTTSNSGLVSNNISSIAIDNANNVWIGTNDSGISMYKQDD